MSRFTFDNDKYHLVVGVDRVFSSFIQVWIQPEQEQEMYALGIDNQGVCEIEKIPELSELVAETKLRFELSRKRGNLHPNLDAATACRFAQRLGFNIDAKIYEIFD